VATDATGPLAAGRPEPSGLFPAGPPRPRFTEPHPVRTAGVVAGLAAGAVWMALFALLGSGVRSHVWWTVVAGAVAWLTAWTLARYGDRGAAVGVALAVGAGWTGAAGVVALYWSVTGAWPLW
jgi:hypothetical protein